MMHENYAMFWKQLFPCEKHLHISHLKLAESGTEQTYENFDVFQRVTNSNQYQEKWKYICSPVYNYSEDKTLYITSSQKSCQQYIDLPIDQSK